ncbi:lachesin isoform X2 [Anabrus simplex]|uniref:lachesin isoform X2 n=1 Tax=Anabrus simplex TaxID=316456 RepID=UPI0035A356E8
MAVMSVKVWTLLFGLLVFSLLAKQGSCRPGEGTEAADAESDYNADEPDYDDDLDEDEDEEENTGPPPSFISHSLSLSLRPGDTATLPCEVQNAASYVVLWLNGSTTLTMESEVMTKDPRIVKHKMDNKLEIHGVTPDDSGLYTCQIVSNPLLNLTHKVMVTSPPKVIKVHPDFQRRTLKVGDPLTLECEIGGWPEPTVTWTREGKNLPGGKKSHEGKILSFDKVTPHHAGTYQCVADNGIKPAATGTATINVSYAPEVTVEPGKVRTGLGEDVNLMCTVHASPSARVQWLKDGKPVTEKKHHHSTRDGSHHKYHIRRLQKEDFGKYTCQAKNMEGTEEKHVDVTGEPNIPRFITAHHTDDMKTTLEWVVESFSNITGYVLMYRKKMDADWITEYPKTEHIEGNMYKVKHPLGPLSAGEYEAVLRSENEFGSTESERHFFTQTPKSNSSAADTRPRLLALLTIFILSSFFL